MNVDLEQIVGLAAAGLATYFATWATQMRPLDRRLKAIDTLDVQAIIETARNAAIDEVRPIRDEVTKLTERANTCQHEHTRHEEVEKRLDERVQQCVRNEDFQAFTTNTTTNIQSLGEKLAHTVGAIGAWGRSLRGGD